MKVRILLVALAAIMHDGMTYAPDSDNDTFECSEKEADVLIAAGVAKQVDPIEEKDPLLSKTVKELRALAEERKVVVPEGITKKEDIVAFLNSPEGQGEA